MIRTTLLLLLLATSAAVATAEVSIDSTSSAAIGSEVEVSVSGSTNPLDFVSIVLKSAKEGAYDAYQYVRPPGVVKLTAPAKPGDYEIRVLGADRPYPTLARRALRVDPVTVSLDAPARVAAGDSFKVQWTGPGNALDYVP